jgi:hypothetical protein
MMSTSAFEAKCWFKFSYICHKEIIKLAEERLNIRDIFADTK